MTDFGIESLLEFNKAFNVFTGDPDKPEVPKSTDSHTKADLRNYTEQAVKFGKELKQLAANAKERGDDNGALILIRLQLIQEELSELAEAFCFESIVDSYDALVDLSYVVDGTYLTLGLHKKKLAGYTEVHRSNMSKLDDNGKPIISSAGRVVKGPNYSIPRLDLVLEADYD